MSDNSIAKMKVADLKRELRLRGLTVTGSKAELQDRLQSALLEGESDLLLDDTGLGPGDDLLDEDAVLTSDDEAKILAVDENELLKSPVPLDVSASELELLEETSPPPKKVHLKRANSITAHAGSAVVALKPIPVVAETTAAEPPKPIKMSERNPITIGISGGVAEVEPTPKGEEAPSSKVAQLTLQQRLEMRAKKFGVEPTTPTVAVAASAEVTGKSSEAPKPQPTAAARTDITDEKQLEQLRKRAERFGCIVSSKIVALEAEDKRLKRKERFGGAGEEPKEAKLLKRKERFGAVAETPAAVSNASAADGDAWAEKKRLRLARFTAVNPPDTATDVK